VQGRLQSLIATIIITITTMIIIMIMVMQNDTANLSLDSLVTLKHDLAGCCSKPLNQLHRHSKPLNQLPRHAQARACSHQLRGAEHADHGE